MVHSDNVVYQAVKRWWLGSPHSPLKREKDQKVGELALGLLKTVRLPMLTRAFFLNVVRPDTTFTVRGRVLEEMLGNALLYHAASSARQSWHPKTIGQQRCRTIMLPFIWTCKNARNLAINDKATSPTFVIDGYFFNLEVTRSQLDDQVVFSLALDIKSTGLVFLVVCLYEQCYM